MLRYRFRLMVLCAFLCAAQSALAVAPSDFIPPLPKDFSKVDFYLQTAGIGSEIYMLGGHTLLRVVDRSNNFDASFNWGVFNFADPLFFYDFVRGYQIYWMEAYSQAAVSRIYYYEKRAFWQEKVNLTNKQKETFMKRIIWQSQPENRTFLYHWYNVNCSTKVRDYLDEALKGGVKQFSDGKFGSATLRDSVRWLMGPHPFEGATVEVLMNSELEDRMTMWQEMFLPVKMREYLLEAPQYDDNGRPIPGTKLLSDTQQIYDFPPPTPWRFNGFEMIGAGLTLVVLAAVLAVLAWWRSRRGQKLAFRMLGFAALVWGSFSGFFGCVMPLVWTFSLHNHGYHNANQVMFWFVDVLLIRAAFSWFWKPAPLDGRRLWVKALRWVCLLHLVTLPIFAILYISGLIVQDVHRILLYYGPAAMLMYFLVWRRGISSPLDSSNQD